MIYLIPVTLFILASASTVAADEKPSLSLMEAVYLTLQNQLDIKLSMQQLYFSQGQLQASAGPFDPLFEGREKYTELNNVQDPSFPVKTRWGGHDSLCQSTISKKTRLGTIYALDMAFESSFNPTSIPARLNTELISFTIRQPLLRGFRYGTDTMIEQANAAEVEATYFDMLQEISLRIYNTINAYWEMVAAKKNITILASSVERFETLIKNTEKLIKEDQLAKADLVQPLAQLASKKIDLAFAEQFYFQTFEDLKFAINIVEEIPCARESFFDLDDFPLEEFSLEAFNKISCPLLKATYERYDVLAAIKRELAAQFLVDGSRNEMLPQLDVVGGVAHKNFSTAARGVLGNINGGPAENDWSIGVNFSIPLHNDRSKGQLQQALARQAEAQLRIQQLLQMSLKDLRTALNNQITLAKNLLEAREAVKENQTLVNNESKKLGAGFSTLFFLIDFENRLTDALTQQVGIQKAYLQNIARLHFLSATLFSRNGPIDTIEPGRLSSLRFFD